MMIPLDLLQCPEAHYLAVDLSKGTPGPGNLLMSWFSIGQ